MNKEHVAGLKYRWVFPQIDAAKAVEIATTYSISLPVAQVLVARGMTDKQEIYDFLFGIDIERVPHPSLLTDSMKAVARIEEAIARKEPILVFGDYDVDGITSTSMMMMALLPLGAVINFYLPNRVKDGYGLSVHIVERAVANNYKLIVTVDNGISAFQAVERARELGIDVIITDHHKAHEQIPDAYAVVNPNRLDCRYPFKYLAGVGVTFKLLWLLYQQRGLQLPMKVYELLLLGTVADVVPLLQENRFWVRHGLRIVNERESVSFACLRANGNVAHDVAITSSDIGFSIAPQINALGRLQDPRQAVKFLIGTQQDEIDHVGRVLRELNEERKKMERAITQQVINFVEASCDLTHERIICVSDTQWPTGIIGLVASRIVGQYARPTILLHEGNGGILKGSCRSISQFDMFAALHDAKELLLSFGGHAHAAGLSLNKEQLPALKSHLEKRAHAMLTQADLVRQLMIDAHIELSDVNGALVKDLRHLEPFGNSNTIPLFVIQNVSLLEAPVLLKDVHVKCRIVQNGIIKPIIFFNRPDLFAHLQDKVGESLHVVAQVKENHWNGKTQTELLGIDAI